MTNDRKELTTMERGVDILKLVSQKWMFMIPVKNYPDHKVSEEVKTKLGKFVDSIGCKLTECGSGTASYSTLIVAYTVKIEDEEHVDELVQKVKEFLAKEVVPVV